jgi:hypothetical protein
MPVIFLLLSVILEVSVLILDSAAYRYLRTYSEWLSVFKGVVGHQTRESQVATKPHDLNAQLYG